jgi:hypothetical protein
MTGRWQIQSGVMRVAMLPRKSEERLERPEPSLLMMVVMQKAKECGLHVCKIVFIPVGMSKLEVGVLSVQHVSTSGVMEFAPRRYYEWVVTEVYYCAQN